MKDQNFGRIQLLLTILSFVGLLCIGFPAGQVLADGTETLGDPSIDIAEGTGIVAAGVGLQDAQPETISIDVPGQVVQVLLYWAGAATDSNPADDTISVNDVDITGTLIGGPAFFFSAFGKEFFYSNFRADITDLGLVNNGPNILTVEGLDNEDIDQNGENSGAGVLVIFDDGSAITDIGIKDGLDLAFAGFPEPRMSTFPQIFNFGPASFERTADLVIFAGSVGQEGDRTSIIRVSVDGATTDFPNELASVDGDLWDTLTIPVVIPADASELTVEIISGDGGPGNPASLNWIGAGLSVPPGAAPSIDIRKQAEGPDSRTFPSGSDVSFEIVVTNTGNVDLENVVVTDILVPVCDMDIGFLASGDSVTYTCTALYVTEGFVNEACVTGERNGVTVDDCDPSTVEIEGGGEGCTPGFWKQSQHFDSWVGFAPRDDYESVFGVDASFDKTLLGALGQGGGGEKALGRHAVAALLNSSNSQVSYAFTIAEVIAIVQGAYATGDFEGAKNLLEAENEQGCPLN